MSQKTQDALIGALVMALLVGAALAAYALGAVEIAAMLAGAGAGYLAPRGVPRTTGGGAGLLLAVSIGAATLSGCGASALQTQARAQLAAGTLLAAAGDVEREARRAELAECVDQARETGDRAAGEACVASVERAHAPFHLAHDSSRSSLVLWVEATELAERAGGGDELLGPVVQAAARFLLTYDPIAEAMRQLGLDAPPLPALLSAGLELGGAR